MTFTYETTTSIGKVRMIIGDKDDTNVIFQDAEIEAFLSLASDDVRLAAAGALDTMASDQAMVLKVIRTMDLSTDGAAVARSLREHAAQLRTDAEQAEAGEGGLFDYAEMAVNEFTKRERVEKQALRGI